MPVARRTTVDCSVIKKFSGWIAYGSYLEAISLSAQNNEPPPARDILCENKKRPNGRFKMIHYFLLIELIGGVAPIFTDRIVKSPKVVKSVNYEDFSLLCADGIPLLMEDHKPRPCQPRPWLPEHKCPTGFWCHEGQSEASFYCCPSSRKFANKCHLPPAVGYGKQRMRRFYFDWKTDACHELQYSGIGGNENSFMDYEKCETACRGAGEPPILLPSNMKILPKDNLKEKKVVYPKEVASKVSLAPPTQPTPKKEELVEVFYTASPQTATPTTPATTATTSQRTSTTTSTSTTTTTTTTTTPRPIDPNPCDIAPDKGEAGQMVVSMWYFDSSSHSCSPFVYLGSGGNSNRFSTSEECVQTCGIGKPTRKSCEQPPAVGDGPFNIPRYYFDQVTKKCEQFFYSGRNGNSNRFYKKNKCERLCLRKKTKKKENIPEYISTSASFETFSTVSVPDTTTHPPTMRIVQNLVPEFTNVFEFTTVEPIRSSFITVAPYEEVYAETTPSSYPTLIYPPRGEEFPTISPIVQQPASKIADRVFSSLMTSQEQKVVEINPVETTTQKVSSHEYIMEKSLPPYSMNSHNSYRYGVQPASPLAPIPQPAAPIPQTVAPINQYPMPQFPPVIQLPEQVSASRVYSTVPVPPHSQTESPMFTFVFSGFENNQTTIAPYFPNAYVKPDPYVPFPAATPSAFIPITSPTTIATTTTTTPTTTTTTPPPLPPSLSPPPSTLPPSNHKFITSISNDSPCRRHVFGDATIMCEARPEVCPFGTFCQIGQGQSICCPILDEPPCEQSVEEGIGNSQIRRWYFDPATRLCQPFVFRGFKGNQNNFLLFDDCQRACGATNVCTRGTPQLAIHNHLLSCSFDSDCPPVFSCVLSTPHNLCCPTDPSASFPTLAPASNSIPSGLPNSLVIDFVAPNVCEQPIDEGFGLSSEHRWAFSNGQCSSFLYKGQGGNMNNFLTKNDCSNRCEKEQTGRCSQPAESGHADQYISRYFYSPEYRQCLHFIYSGEGGNSNNFETLTECLEVCVANGVKFSSLAKNNLPQASLPQTSTQSQINFSFLPRQMCPQGDPLVTIDGTPIECDYRRAAKCPGDHVCTPVGEHAYCCPSPMNYCLQSRPALSVCNAPNFEPIKEIRFTYDPLADRCIRFNYQNCRNNPSNSLNNFLTNTQCSRLCCNQGYNLVYKRRLLKNLMHDEPIED
ncbi:unnamed protein product [Caenorhabditis bovis]|uniref:BPTI/Kunitz inhibitor domain-containing protein n=1 Tax=Caenorhabditis bovis TaxID=2654633 RepID=A0A8S1E8U8_9PELO|nr:unnamed protein product [Caenorhabditis bovis]